MRFFVPDVPDDQAEEHLTRLAAASGVRVPPPDQRVESITFENSGEEIEATVGRRLMITKWPTKRSGRPDPTKRPKRREDATTVLAILPGSPWHVWLKAGAGPEWANPVWATPDEHRVRYFDPPQVQDTATE